MQTSTERNRLSSSVSRADNVISGPSRGVCRNMIGDPVGLSRVLPMKCLLTVVILGILSARFPTQASAQQASTTESRQNATVVKQEDLKWRPGRKLPKSDREAARKLVSDWFKGWENPPSVEPKAATYHADSGHDLFIVRWDSYASCGDWIYVIFDLSQKNTRLGTEPLCGYLEIMQVRGQKIPDLMFPESRDHYLSDGTFAFADHRFRWTGQEWELMRR